MMLRKIGMWIFDGIGWVFSWVFITALYTGFIYGDLAQGEIKFKWPWQRKGGE